MGNGGIHTCLEEGLFSLVSEVDCVESISAWNRWDWKREDSSLVGGFIVVCMIPWQTSM